MMKQGKHRELIIITLFGSNNRKHLLTAQNGKLRLVCKEVVKLKLSWKLLESI